MADRVVPAPVEGEPARQLARPSGRVALVFLALLVVAAALDGSVGGAVVVFVGAVLLAGLPLDVLGRVGVVALALVPLILIVQGVPTAASVSPAFVSHTMLPHHLAFIGISLVSAGAVLDLVPHLAGGSTAVPAIHDDPGPVGGWPVPLRIAIVVVVAAAALVASAVVLGA